MPRQHHPLRRAMLGLLAVTSTVVGVGAGVAEPAAAELADCGPIDLVFEPRTAGAAGPAVGCPATVPTYEGVPDGPGTPGTGEVWILEGDSLRSLTDTASSTPVRQCDSRVRARVLWTTWNAGYTWDVIGGSHACHVYDAASRTFKVNARIIVCEVPREHGTGFCYAGTKGSGVDLYAVSNHVDYRADGGRRLTHRECGFDANAFEAGAHGDCLDGPFGAARGHRYNAWAGGTVVRRWHPYTILDVAYLPTSTSPEQYVS